MSSLTPDPLLDTLEANAAVQADRLHYATGELLGADDFSVEQTYHRRQLARALLFLHGSGSVVGLKVTATPQVNPLDLTQLDEVLLTVSPGLAIDRAGRLIELTQTAGLRLKRWFNHLAAAAPAETPSGEDNQNDLVLGFHPQGTLGAGTVIADVFLRFHECERAPSPAFATGPFDALDASQPSRVRDGAELKLVLRKEPDTAPVLNDLPNRSLAFDPWSELLSDVGNNPTGAGVLRQLRLASLGAWEGFRVLDATTDRPVHEYPRGFDPTAVLLARVRVPARRDPPADPPPPGAPAPTVVPAGLWTADAWSTPGQRVNNHIRSFVIPPAAAFRALQVL